MFCFEGNGGDKSLPAREGTLDKVLRGRDRDDHHQSRKVGAVHQINLFHSKKADEYSTQPRYARFHRHIFNPKLQNVGSADFFPAQDFEIYTERNRNENTEHLVNVLTPRRLHILSWWPCREMRYVG